MRTPFLLKPVPKDYLWGGSRLNDEFNLNLPADPLAEAWMCSTHPDGQSYVPSFDCTLGELLLNKPSYLGRHALQITEGVITLPILIKLIDAKSDLSVQVHPDDEYAKLTENSLGKTEMWYVLEANSNTSLVYGFNQNMNRDNFESVLQSGEIEKYLNYVPVHKDDLFFIEAGIVHAIGAGALIAEIQESSNITYRLYDYDRFDKNGNKRPLHIEKALEVIDFQASNSPRQPMRVLKYKKGCASELLARCKYFQVERVLINSEPKQEPVRFKTENNSFHVLLCIDGYGEIKGTDFFLSFFKGDCIFVPAESIDLCINGKAQILDVSC